MDCFALEMADPEFQDYYPCNNDIVQDEKPHDNLDLSLVKEVTSIPPDENTSMFPFTIHFPGCGSKSRWLLAAYTKVYMPVIINTNCRITLILVRNLVNPYNNYTAILVC